MRLRSSFPLAVLSCLSLLSWAGCSDGGDDDETSSSPTPIAASSPTPGQGGSPTPEETSSPTSDPFPSLTPEVTASPTPLASLTPEPTPSPTPVSTPTPPREDQDNDGVSVSDGDCDDLDPLRHPGAQEVPYDEIDQDCSGADLTDVDGDHQDAAKVGGADCNDEDPTVYAGAEEVAYDGVDQDCSGADLTDVDGDGVDSTEAGGQDCDDSNINSYPGAPEYADGHDNDCDGQIDEALSTTDDDGDGYAETDGDCNDTDASIHPGVAEVAYDGIDQDCSGADLTDVDGDGASSSTVANGTDCNDADKNIYPAATELCDGIDNNCDGVIDADAVDRDTFYPDGDGDGYGDSKQPVKACAASGNLVIDGTDCNDGSAASHPGAVELCDSLDNNCDGQVDEGVKTTYYRDADGDGYGNAGASTQACSKPTGYVGSAGDCDDANAASHPGATETCNGVDDDCDLSVDEAVKNTYYLDLDHDGYGSASQTTQACTAPSGYVTDSTDCKDTNDDIHPGALEVCNAVDDDCDGQVDEGVKSSFYQDSDKDGFGSASVTTQACAAPAGYVDNGADCNDSSNAVYPGALETCNGVDDDCDTRTDEGLTSSYYRDVDQDGYGSASVSTQACTQPAGYVTNSTDCDDSSTSVNPKAMESCNAVDDNCNGLIDEEVKSTFYQDSDGDGYGNVAVPTQACSAPVGYVKDATDCNDSSNPVHPGATESCNGVDDDCDAQIDEGVKTTYYVDADKDGYGNASATLQACSTPSGYVGNSTDCNDGAAAVNPGASESANGVDDNCDGQVDEGVSFPSCKEIKAAIPSSASGMYYVDPDGVGGAAAFQAYCDMTTDGGGWTLAVNINSDLGPINLFVYDNRSSDPVNVNYGIKMSQFPLNTSTSYRLACVESSDGTARKMFIKGLNPAEPIFQASGTLTHTNLVCSQSADYSSPQTGENCILGGYEDSLHTYYGNAAWDMDWALYSPGSAYTLRHCANRGTGYFNKGKLWFR